MSDKPIGLSTLSTIRDWVKGLIPTKTSDLTNDSDFATTSDIPTPPTIYALLPKMDAATAEFGTSTAYARADHVHPSDTSKADVSSVPTKVSDLTNDSGFTSNIGTVTMVGLNDEYVMPGSSGAVDLGNIARSVKMNGTTFNPSTIVGEVDLGTVLTSHQDISGKVNKSGDTMTGSLRIDRSIIVGTDNAPYNENTHNFLFGNRNTGYGGNSFAAGEDNFIISDNGSAEGKNIRVAGDNSHAEGYGTTAESDNQHVSGKFNVVDTNDTYAEIVGNGTATDARSNARTLDWNGNATYAGKVTVGAAPTANMDVATKQYVDTAVSGAGDMSTAVYDTDSDGVVDEAEAVSNVSGTGGIEFGLDADGKGQYRAVGAATWIPFLTGGSAFDSLDTDNCFHFGTEQSDEFAKNVTKTYTLTGLEAGKEYMMIPVQVVATGTPHMWIGGNSYTQTFNGATLEESKSNNVLTFQRISVTSNNPTMTIENTSGYRNRFCIFVFLL